MCVGLTAAVLCYETATGYGMVANGVTMAVIGMLVAGPDALLGSSAIADTCEAAGYGSEVLGRGVIENELSTDVESTPPPPRVCMSCLQDASSFSRLRAHSP